MKGTFMHVKEWSIIINVVGSALSGIFFNVWHHKQLRTFNLGEQSNRSLFLRKTVLWSYTVILEKQVDKVKKIICTKVWIINSYQMDDKLDL